MQNVRFSTKYIIKPSKKYVKRAILFTKIGVVRAMFGHFSEYLSAFLLFKYLYFSML